MLQGTARDMYADSSMRWNGSVPCEPWHDMSAVCSCSNSWPAWNLNGHGRHARVSREAVRERQGQSWPSGIHRDRERARRRQEGLRARSAIASSTFNIQHSAFNCKSWCVAPYVRFAYICGTQDKVPSTNVHTPPRHLAQQLGTAHAGAAYIQQLSPVSFQRHRNVETTHTIYFVKRLILVGPS